MENYGNNYVTLTKEEKKEYHRKYMFNMRNKKWEYFGKIQRGILGRYIEEKRLFNENDMNYIKSIEIKESV